MYKIKWYRPKGIFEASGGASANSLFFETKEDHVLFLEHWNHFMGDYAYLLHYSFTEVSWAILFETKSQEEIESAYDEKRKHSKKVKSKTKNPDIGRILSQAMRFMLSNYVVQSNRKLGKNGSRVKRRFHKFGFMDGQDLEDRKDQLEQMQKLYQQTQEKYRPNVCQSDCTCPKYDEAGEMDDRGVFRSAKLYYDGIFSRHFCVKNFKIMLIKSKVLRYILESTYQHYFHLNSSQNPPPKKE